MLTAKRIRYTTIVAILLLATSVLATTGIPDPDMSTATSAGGVIYICPAGDGEPLGNATITVTLLDAGGSPVAGYPRQDIWVESVVPGELVFCPGGNIADTDTDVTGMTTFSGTLVGGGCTQGGLQVVVSGTPLAGPPLVIDVNSPDINGDLRVDLCDLIPFVYSFFGSYSFCADIHNHNSVVDIGDVAILSQHLCAYCAGDLPAPVVTTSGEIGVFFDAAGTQTGTMGITPGTLFDIYVVALSAPGGIAAYQFGLTVNHPSIVVVRDPNVPPSTLNVASGINLDMTAVPGNGCLQVNGPTVLAHYDAIMVEPLTDIQVCLGPPSEFLCGWGPADAAYVSCLDGCDWRVFNRAYDGCAFINGIGPITTESASWSALKALFR